MASMREIKRRRGSIQSTQQITKAMKLVSTVKLQKARMRAENSKAYFEYMYQTVTSMLAKAGNIEHPYLRKSDSKNVAVVAVKPRSCGRIQCKYCKTNRGKRDRKRTYPALHSRQKRCGKSCKKRISNCRGLLGHH